MQALIAAALGRLAGATDGYKTYAAAVGLAGLAVYAFTAGDYQKGIELALAALAATGIRAKLASGPSPPPTPPAG